MLCMLTSLAICCAPSDTIYAQSEIVHIEIDESIIVGTIAKKAFNSDDYQSAVEVVTESLKRIEQDGRIRLKNEMFAIYY